MLALQHVLEEPRASPDQAVSSDSDDARAEVEELRRALSEAAANAAQLPDALSKARRSDDLERQLSLARDEMQALAMRLSENEAKLSDANERARVALAAEKSAAEHIIRLQVRRLPALFPKKECISPLLCLTCIGRISEP